MHTLTGTSLCSPIALAAFMVDLFPFCRESAEFRVKELRHVLDETFQHFVGEEDDEEDEEEEEFGNGQAEVEEEEEEVAQL